MLHRAIDIQKHNHGNDNRIFGVTVKENFWTQGQYDIVMIVEAQDELSVTALNMSLCGLGNVRTQTLRAFAADEMKQIIAKMA